MFKYSLIYLIIHCKFKLNIWSIKDIRLHYWSKMLQLPRVNACFGAWIVRATPWLILACHVCMFLPRFHLRVAVQQQYTNPCSVFEYSSKITKNMKKKNVISILQLSFSFFNFLYSYYFYFIFVLNFNFSYYLML